MSPLRDLLFVFTGWRTPEPSSDHLKAFRYAKGKYLQRVWVSEQVEALPADLILIGLGSIDTTAISDRFELELMAKGSEHRISVADCRRCLVTTLSMPPIDDVPRSADGQVVYRLDLAITEMDPGESLLRYAVPYGFGIGVAWLQVEGCLTDERSKLPIFSFVERRRNGDMLGLAWLRGWVRGEPLQSMTGRTLVQELAASIALDTLREIKAVLAGSSRTGASHAVARA